MKMKAETEPDTVVAPNATLTECLQSCGIEDADHITTDRLECGANAKMFQRFDNFNDSYAPFGKQDLRTVFMKTSNHIDGRFFAEVLRDVVFKRVQEQRAHEVALEPRLSIYGKVGEWKELATYFIKHRLFSVNSDGHL